MRLMSFVCLLMLSGFGADVAKPDVDPANVQIRSGLPNAHLQFEQHKKGCVAFLGGSITEMEGYRPMVCASLKKRFPNTEFNFIAAGISSTCSTTGAFRLESDVLSKGSVDLLFVDSAVNDDQDANHTRDEVIRALEGIVRHARRSNPNIEIVFTYFVNEGMLKTLQEGKTPLTIEAAEAVAEHYAVPSILHAKEVAREITAGTMDWKKYGGVHPAPAGNAICAALIDKLFDMSWNVPQTAVAAPAAHANPPKPLDEFNYENGRFLPLKDAQTDKNWTIAVPNWKALKGGKRGRFTTIDILSATEPGAEIKLNFEGTAVGAYVLAGPDAGIVTASVDGGETKTVDLYHRFSSGLHYPRTVLFGEMLKPGKHTLVLKIAQETKSAGHAVRIMQLVGN